MRVRHTGSELPKPRIFSSSLHRNKGTQCLYKFVRCAAGRRRRRWRPLAGNPLAAIPLLFVFVGFRLPINAASSGQTSKTNADFCTGLTSCSPPFRNFQHSVDF
ncbi:hypothetical protein U1Q18_020862 [Sarracenia purpurea var. burkii]